MPLDNVDPLMKSASESETSEISSEAAISNAELESMRRHSIRVLGSVANALEAAGRQRQTLFAEVHTAQKALRVLANERALAEATLVAKQAQLNLAASKVEHAEGQRIAILQEVEDVRSAGVRNRTVLAAEIEALEHQRDVLAKVVDRRPIPSIGSWRIVRGRVGSSLEQLLMPHPIHPGFGNVATALFIALFLAMALLLSPLVQVFGGVQLLAVTSGSMAPAIPSGSIVAIRPVPAASLKIGDVITFVSPTAPDVLITHRVASVDVRDGQTMLTTKGDANDAVDALSAPAERAVGRVDFALPWLGDAMVWLGSLAAKITVACLAFLALGLSIASIQRSTRRSVLVH